MSSASWRNSIDREIAEKDMNDLISLQLDDAQEQMQKALNHTENELTKIRAGKAMPSMLDGLNVDYYGSATPISQVANVNTPDPRTLVIQPWEKNMLQVIEKAIIDSSLGLNPQNDGSIIRLVIPILTEERRRELVKKVKDEGERGRVAVRNIRKDANDQLKKLKNEGLSEDEIKVGEAEVQKLTDSFIAKVERLIESKEKDIMTV